MKDGFWVFVVTAAIVIFAVGGYVLGRRNAGHRHEVDRLKDELARANQQIEQMREGVNHHFEQSAALFSQLSQDYRQFLDHFQDSATTLGLSQERAEELIDQGARPLLAHSGNRHAQVLEDAGNTPSAPADEDESAAASPHDSAPSPQPAPDLARGDPPAAGDAGTAAQAAPSGNDDTHHRST